MRQMMPVRSPPGGWGSVRDVSSRLGLRSVMPGASSWGPPAIP